MCPVTLTAIELRILAMDEAKTAKISNFWTFWPVIQLIGQNVQKSLICAVQVLLNTYQVPLR